MTESCRSLRHWRRHVELRRSARARHIRLKVHPPGRVEVVVPRNFDERGLAAILDQHEPWVLRTLEKQGHVPGAGPVEPPRTLRLPAIGEQWEIEYLGDDGGRYGCRPRQEGVLRVSGGGQWQPALKRWLARKGRAHLLPWLEQVSDEVGLPYQGASIRAQRTRWGSCSSRKQINLNSGLLFLPPPLVRYLFIHELCHTRHMNHSSRYWQLVAGIEPGYRALDRELRQAVRYLPLWLHAPQLAAATPSIPGD